jgi:hypothetical protein
MRRSAILSFGAVVAVGLLGLVAVAGIQRRAEAFTLGVIPAVGVARLAPDHEICQKPIDVVEEFRRVRLQVSTFSGSGPPVVVKVHDALTGASLVRKRVPGGYPDNAVQTVTLPKDIPDGGRVGVCVRNVGDRAMAPYGNSGLSNQTSEAYLDGRRLEGDMAIVFLRDEPKSMIALVPSIVERASLFHGSWASRDAYWALLVALLFGTTSLSVLAVRAAVGDES